MSKIALLVLIFLSLSVAGCGNDLYSIERKFWYAKKEVSRIYGNLEASPPNEVERAVHNLDKLIDEHKETALAVEAEFVIARLYIAKKDFAQGRARCDAIIKKYEKFQEVCAEAIFLKGNSYEIEEKWDVALTYYKKLMGDYALTRKGLSVPIYIAVRYKNKYQPDKMISAYQEAIAHYLGLAESKPDTQLAYMSYMLVTECYAAMKDWQQVVATLDTMISKFNDKVNVAELMINKALVYKEGLKDDQQAVKILRSVTQEYPKTRAAQLAEAFLKKVEKK